jgi:hypothetical protein
MSVIEMQQANGTRAEEVGRSRSNTNQDEDDAERKADGDEQAAISHDNEGEPSQKRAITRMTTKSDHNDG